MTTMSILLEFGSWVNDIESKKKMLIDGVYHNVKLSTNKISITPDRKNPSLVSKISDVKIIFKKKSGGILVVRGSLGCNFKEPFGGSFFCIGMSQEETDFETVKGVDISIKFITSLEAPTSIDDMQSILTDISKSQDFEYNISQFDEFMEVFEYYKTLSTELNNNINLAIKTQSKPYYFIPSEIATGKDIFKQEIKNQNGVLIGYRIDEIEYDKLTNEVADNAMKVIDISVEGGLDEVNRIKKVGLNNIYVSNFSNISEHNIQELKQFSIKNYILNKNGITLTGEFKKDEDYDESYLYLNIYDMGQKIKVESIDNSLRLINKGTTGAASELLEYLIGDKQMVNDYRKRVSNSIKEKYMEGLNESQRKAFLMAVDGSPVSLIKGPPGTGKTHVINSIVQYITKELKEKVVISSQTHIAIDNVLDKLMENYDLIIPNRITNKKNKYSDEEIDKTLYKTWGSKFSNHNKRASDQNLASLIENQLKNFNGKKIIDYSSNALTTDYSVIGATTTTSAIAGKKGLEVLKGYDWLIIDEVSKCPITEVLRYLPYVSRIIMVGDDYQLAPLLEFTKDDVKDLPSYDEELFDKLVGIYQKSVFSKVMKKAIKKDRLVLLNENYRSVNQVLTAYNVFYNHQLIGKREIVKPNKVQFSTNGVIDYNAKDIFFVEVKGGQEVKDGFSRYNVQEIEATKYMLEDLMKTVIDPEKVTVSAIFPYGAQIAHFQKENIELINRAKRYFKSFEIDTVDAFQGKESDIVLVNTVVTDSSQRNFLNDFRRINVSMSRARDKLIIFGNNRVLSRIRMNVIDGNERQYFKDIIDYIKAYGKYIEYDGGVITNGIERENTVVLI